MTLIWTEIGSQLAICVWYMTYITNKLTHTGIECKITQIINASYKMRMIKVYDKYEKIWPVIY